MSGVMAIITGEVVTGLSRLDTGSAPIAEALGIVDPCGEFRVP